LVFTPRNRKNKHFFATNFKIQGGQIPSCPPFRRPCKNLAVSKAREHLKGMSGPCDHCALCGNHGKHNKSMVSCVSQIMGKNKTFPLNQKFTCANHGVYVATCVICQEQYVGQTKNKFFTR